MRTLAGLVVLVACTHPTAPVIPLALHACRVPHVPDELQCGALDVPEDRAHPGGRHLALPVVVLPARAGLGHGVPLFSVQGGPGIAATIGAPIYATELAAFRDAGDIALVDQRGTGDGPSARPRRRRPRRRPRDVVRRRSPRARGRELRRVAALRAAPPRRAGRVRRARARLRRRARSDHAAGVCAPRDRAHDPRDDRRRAVGRPPAPITHADCLDEIETAFLRDPHARVDTSCTAAIGPPPFAVSP